ncbi:zinc ribbon domain-containing protein [Promethearchaeum syntrophicum]|uniref:Zinc ribbon domain-containing protein n=1 Tax=Promethearchaeum syntrophicum TaxID=2594042 RepID=A0A5B9D665_9ARCH|nr:zinc ribbon domain-containing protein [Candidatus Prometheoarchaeum syntrophicum]QEE14476.1 Putative transposase DNA-binding domain protein [Candidatus Prometheoarchaeum syntrophicum]
MTIENPNPSEYPEDHDYYSFEHDYFKLDKKGKIITDVPIQIRNLIVNEPCNMSLDCISLKEFTIKYGIHRILGLEKPEQVTYDYFDYKRNKKIVLSPDSPLYILQNILIPKGPHTDPDDPYNNEVLYPELSMDDIDPGMDMRELAHCMRPNSDFYVFIQDPDPKVINLSIRKHRYQIGNIFRTLTMSAGNIFKTKNPKDTETIKSIHDKIHSKNIDLKKIPFNFDEKDINNHLKSLQTSKNKIFKRNEIYRNLLSYVSKRSKLKLNPSYFDIYNNIFNFAHISQQFRFSENVQGFYCDEDLSLFSDDLSKILSNLKKKFGELLNKESESKLKRFKKNLDGSDEEKKKKLEEKEKELEKELRKLEKLLPDDESITFLQTFESWKIDYVQFFNKVNSKINSTLVFPSPEDFSDILDIYLSKHEKSLYKIKKNRKKIYEKHFKKNEEVKNAIFQNLNRTTEKTFGSKPFSHALGLIKTPSPLTFIQNSETKFNPLVRFNKNVFKSLNREIIKKNRSEIAFHIIDPKTKKLNPLFKEFHEDLNNFYRKYLEMIETTSDFSIFSSLIPDEKSEEELENLDIKKKITISNNFNNLFNKFTNYGLKYAFFSETGDFYTEDEEDLFKFGKNSPQIYSCNDYNYVDLIVPKKGKNKIILKKGKNIEEKSINLTNFPSKLSKILPTTDNFFNELINSLKNQYYELNNTNYGNLNNIVYEKKHKKQILQIIALSVDIISESFLTKQKSPIQYIHFSQGLTLLKCVEELVDNYAVSCEKCLVIKSELNKSKKELINLQNDSKEHWKFFKNSDSLQNEDFLELLINKDEIPEFERTNPLFSTLNNIMESRELWFNEQIKNLKIIISLLLNNPQLKSSGIVKSLKSIIQETNRVKRRQPWVKDFEDIAAKIKIEYKEITKEIVSDFGINEDLTKILKIIENFMDFDNNEYLYLNPIKIENDDDSFHRVFSKIIRSERDISKIIYRTIKKNNYPIINTDKIYKWKQNFKLKHIGLENTNLNSWTECMKEYKEIVFKDKDGDIVFDWKKVWHDHRQLNYLCHHVIKLDSKKKYISSDHIKNSKELVNWLKGIEFTPGMIKDNWEKDNRTFLLTKKFLKSRDYSISSLKDINKIKQSLYEEKKLFSEFPKEVLIFDNFFEIDKETEHLDIKNPFDISEETMDNYDEISKKLDITKKEAIENHFLLNHLLKRPNFRKTNFEIFTKKITLEKLDELKKYESYSLQSLLSSSRVGKSKSYHYYMVGHYNRQEETDILRQIYLLIFIPVKVPNTEIYNYYLLTSKFGLKTENQFKNSQNASSSKNWRIFQEFKDLTDSLLNTHPPDEKNQNFWTSKICDDSKKGKNFTIAYFDDNNSTGPPLNYIWLKFKQFFSAYENTDMIFKEMKDRILKFTPEIKDLEGKIEAYENEIEELEGEIEEMEYEIATFDDEIEEIERREEIKIWVQQMQEMLKSKKNELKKLKNKEFGSVDFQTIRSLYYNYAKFFDVFLQPEITKINTQIKKLERKKTLTSIQTLTLNSKKDELEKMKSVSKTIEKFKNLNIITTSAEFIIIIDTLIIFYNWVTASLKSNKKFHLGRDPRTENLKRIISAFISLLYRKTPTPYKQLLSSPLKSVIVSIKPNGKIILSVGCAVPFIQPTSYMSKDGLDVKNKLGIDLGLREFLNYDALEGDTKNTSIDSFDEINKSIDKMIKKTKKLSSSASQFQKKLDLTYIKKKPSYFRINYLNYKQKINTKEQNIADTSIRQSIEVIADYVKSKKSSSNSPHNLKKHLNDDTVIYIEDLRGFQAKKGSKFSEAAARWLRGNFKDYLEEKSNLSGFLLKTVPPAYTSKLCSVCGKEGLKGYLITIPSEVLSKDNANKLKYIRKNNKILHAPEKPTEINKVKITGPKYKKADLQIWDYKRILNKINTENFLLKTNKKTDKKTILVFIFSQSGIVFHCSDYKTYANRDINASANIHNYDPIIYYAKIINLWIARETRFPIKSQEKIKNQFNTLITQLSNVLSHKIKNIYVEDVNSEHTYSKENENIYFSFKNLSNSEFTLLINTLKKRNDYCEESKQIKSFKKIIKKLQGLLSPTSDDKDLKRFTEIYSNI